MAAPVTLPHPPSGPPKLTLLACTPVPWGVTHTFLIVNVIAMSVCSFLVIARKHTIFGVAGLFGVVITQGLGYGLIFNLNFFLRNLSVVGGLLMVLSDSWVRKKFIPAGLPQLDEKDRKMYVQFAGRVLLIFLFIGFVFSGQWSFWRVLVSLFGFLACVMVVVGFKAKWSAILLVVLLSVFNVLVNNFWTVCSPASCALDIRIYSYTTAPPPPPAKGLRQVRLLPDPLHRVSLSTPPYATTLSSNAVITQRRLSLASQHGPGPTEHGREEESLLNAFPHPPQGTRPMSLLIHLPI